MHTANAHEWLEVLNVCERSARRAHGEYNFGRSQMIKISKMNPKTILDTFNHLKNNKDSIRFNAGITLLNDFYQHNTNEDDTELNHALVRLVRSLGSSNTFTRRGFYSTFTVFLTMHPETSIEKLLSIMNTQLHPSCSNPKRENADIFMGRILLCGALIRSKLLAQNSVEIQQKIIEILLSSGRERSYLLFIAVMFLNEFIIQLDLKSMKEIWLVVEKEVAKPLSEQTLDMFYILLVLRDKYPSLINHKFLKQHLGVKEIITEESMEDIVKILTSLHRTVSHHHPVFKLFCEKLMLTEHLANFWKSIDQKFKKPSTSDEYVVVQILRLLLLNITDKTVIPVLLSPNLLQHMLRRFSNCKKSNNDEVLKAFREVLHLVMIATSDKDVKTKTQLSILKKLILYPGDIMIEKKTGTKVIQTITGNLRLDGIKKLCQLYRDIIENELVIEREDSKTELWTNAERSYAAQLLTRLMGYRETFADQDWRLAQLTFLFNYGLCEVSNVGIELASQFKNSFYRALDYKLPKLDDVRNMLGTLIHDLNSKLQSNEIQLRVPLSDAASDAWKRVINLIGKLGKNTKNVEVLFHTINLHMSLQLFSDPEMAIMSINELQSCYERLNKKSKGQKQLNNADAEEEPKWVEVVVDLLLSLLSRDNHLLRSLVDSVFPHICPYLTPSAVHQILAVLNIKKNQSTLITKQGDEDSSGIESESDNEDDEEEEEEEENVSNSEAFSEESESEPDNDVNENEDKTITDKLRMAVSQALGDAAIQTDDEDIDVDQISEEEGKRLDASLAAAFKILRENRQAGSKKQDRTSQALTHFRVRVIDLLDIYLENRPSMAITLDMIVPLFALLESCIEDPHQKPLEHRVRTCLKKLSMVKQFNEDKTGVDDTLLTTILKALIEKGERSVSICQEISDKLAECCTFLVRCMQKTKLPIESVVEIYTENLTAFFKKRDCVLSFILFKGVLQLCWEGNWQLASLLVDFAFDGSIRYFRRSQALELLLILYNNKQLLDMTMTKYADIRMKLEKTLYKNTVDTFTELSDLNASNNGQTTSCNGVGVQKKVLQKFIGHLLTLLRAVYTNRELLLQAWNWETVKTILTTYSINNNVLFKDAKSAYNKLAIQIGASLIVPKKSKKKARELRTKATSEDSEPIKVNSDNLSVSDADVTEDSQNGNSHNQSKNSKRNRKVPLNVPSKKETRELRTKATSEDLEPIKVNSVNLPVSDADVTEGSQNGNSHQSKNSKRNRKAPFNVHLKKEACELRTKAMSEGLELFKFSTVNLPVNDMDVTEDSQNGNSHNQSTNSKRNRDVEENRESKKRKKSVNRA